MSLVMRLREVLSGASFCFKRGIIFLKIRVRQTPRAVHSPWAFAFGLLTLTYLGIYMVQ